MKRTVPLIITGVSGLILIVSVFVPVMVRLGEDTAVWFDVLAAIAFILGGGNLLKVHLKKISDQVPGWGYSAVTIVAFLLTLFFGLLKFGVSPEASREHFGESYVEYPLALMPEFSVEGTIPERADGEELPLSAIRNIREDEGLLKFRGWMTAAQLSDLEQYDKHEAWLEDVRELHRKSQPPAGLAGKLSYNTDHESLSFVGYMSDVDFALVSEVLGSKPEAIEAADLLRQKAQRVISVGVPPPPAAVVTALAPGEPVAQYLKLDAEGGSLTVHGPLTTGDRNALQEAWPEWERVRPLSGADADAVAEVRRQQADAMIAEIESRGPALSEAQKTAAREHYGTIPDVRVMIDAMNTAGTATGASLSEEQIELVRIFVTTPSVTIDDLARDAGLAGEMTGAVTEFMNTQSTRGQFNRQLAFEILSAGPLSEEQQEWLFAGYRSEYEWKQAIDRLYLASHVTKYPWSGPHEQEGSLFWWMYEFLFRPLVATMFAMLAFYVASAAFRAFRAKNIEALLLLGTAFIILLGNTFVGVAMTAWIPDQVSAFKIDELKMYVTEIFMIAGNRAILIGIALGVASTSLKVLLGVDRSYLGSGDD